MNPYEDPDGGDFRPDEDFDSDMITVNPPRWQRWRPSRPVAAAGLAVVALAGGAGIGYAATHSVAASGAADTAAVAAAASPAPSPSAMPGQGPVHSWRAFPGGLGPLGFGGFGIGTSVAHGQLTVPKSGGGYQTVDVQNGKVTAVSTGSITVKSGDGFTATYTVTSKTVVAAETRGIASVKKGDTVFVTATVSGSTATAADILDLTEIKAGRVSFDLPGRPVNLPKMAAPTQPSSA
jgi:hypothetical protein